MTSSSDPGARDASPPHLPRLASHNAPRCPTCAVVMRVRLLMPGEHEEQVSVASLGGEIMDENAKKVTKVTQNASSLQRHR
jgi:hypothetical protein